MVDHQQLPPRPQVNSTRAYAPDANSLPPWNNGHIGSSWVSRLSPSMGILLIFMGAFVAGILLTWAILAGVIEIQPAMIKGFFKTILGKR